MKRWGLVAMALFLATLAFPAMPTAGQQPAERPPAAKVAAEAPAAEAPAAEASPTSEAQAGMDLIEDLLGEDADVVEGGLAYDPGDRRDPFRSLMVTVEAAKREGPRPEGVAGLLIDQLTVTGVWVTREGPVAQVSSADSPVSFLIRPGDHLFDGDVLEVSYRKNEGAEVLFRQVVEDPTAPKPFREITKRLEP